MLAMRTEVSDIDRDYLRRLEFGKKLTGRSVLVWLLAGFGIMFAANFALIYYALSTLHGEEVENSYDASQTYNARLAAARAQDQLGWTVNVTTRQENGGVRVVTEFRDREGALVPGLEARARFVHPFDRGLDRETPLANDGGDYEGFAPLLKSGRYTLDIEAKLGDERKFFSESRINLSANAE